MKTTLKWDADYCNEVVKVFFKDFEQVNSSISTHKRSSIFLRANNFKNIFKFF